MSMEREERYEESLEKKSHRREEKGHMAQKAREEAVKKKRQDKNERQKQKLNLLLLYDMMSHVLHVRHYDDI